MDASNPITKALDALGQHYWLDGIAAKLAALHRAHGEPQPPQPTFGRTPVVMPFLKPSQLVGLVGYESLALDAYNEGVKAAYQCIDWQYAGLLSAMANEVEGSLLWNAYYAAAKECLAEYFRSEEALLDFDSYLAEPARKYLES